jgi:prepilin-type N-terminal cleavage/methylation domain-containing protein
MSKQLKINKGFTLIELLVVISIIGILIGLSIFGLQGARQSARDSTRKTDLELIRSGLEIYKSDCDGYPVGSGNPVIKGVLVNTDAGSLVGVNDTGSCLTTDTYISQVPTDPIPTANYLYWSDGVKYELCAALEQGGTTVTCGGSSNCGTNSCNYKVTNP